MSLKKRLEIYYNSKHAIVLHLCSLNYSDCCGAFLFYFHVCCYGVHIDSPLSHYNNILFRVSSVLKRCFARVFTRPQSTLHWGFCVCLYVYKTRDGSYRKAHFLKEV